MTEREPSSPTNELRPIDVLKAYPPNDRTLSSFLVSRAKVIPTHEFIVFRGTAISYAQFATMVGKAAAVFAARGIGRGDRVGVMSANHPSIAVSFFALARLGAIMVPVNPDFGLQEASYILNHAEVSGVVCTPEAAQTVRAALALRKSSESATPWVLLNRPSSGTEPVLDDLMASASKSNAPELGAPDATVVLIYTSGTTGLPKGVMHSQRSGVLTGEAFVERMYLQPSDRLLCILPLFHMNALFYSLCGAIAAGATFVLAERFSASQFWSTVAAARATEVNTIAAISNILIERPRSEYIPGHTLRKMYGAPFSGRVYQVFREEFNVPDIVEGYGMSEIPGVVNNPVRGPVKIGSMGILARHPDHSMPFSEVRIVGEDGNELPDGEIGEIAVRTPIIMQGYFHDPAQTEAAFRDGWFLTGDLAHRDPDGYYWFVARKKDIIRRRGENISGAELDRVIGEHPHVAEAAAIAVPSPLGEDDIFVAVVLKDGAQEDPRSIALWCREQLAPIKQPRYIAFVDSLPHTPTHRVAKYKLKEDPDLRSRAIDMEREPRP